MILGVTVDVQVILHQSGGSEGFPTDLTAVWFLPSMNPSVLGEIPALSERGRTDVTFERFLSSVNPDVSGELTVS